MLCLPKGRAGPCSFTRRTHVTCKPGPCLLAPITCPAPASCACCCRRGLEALVDEGLAKSIGLSNASLPQVEEILAAAKHKPVVNQVGGMGGSAG